MTTKKGKTKKKERKIPEMGVVHINSTFNNTIVTISDAEGKTIAWSSGGAVGFKGTKKGTPFAAQVAAQNVARKVMDMGMRTVMVYVKGPGSGRESAIRAVQVAGLGIKVIKDITPIPHNGCRPKKRRRV